jgi:hypothetical protein
MNNNNNNSSSKGKTKLDRAEVARDPNLEVWNDSIKIQNDLNKKAGTDTEAQKLIILKRRSI